MEQVDDGLYDNMQRHFKFNIDYKYCENKFKLEIIDLRPINIQKGDIIEVHLLTEDALFTDEWDGPILSKSDINSMSQFIRLTKTKLLSNYFFGGIYLFFKSRFTYRAYFISA